MSDEWIGAVVELPAAIAGEARSRVMMWMDTASGMLLAGELVQPGEDLTTTAARAFGLAKQRLPAHVPPPRRIRVSTPELAEAVRATIGSIALVVAPTPEVTEVAESMRAYFEDVPPSDEPLVSAEVPATVVASFFAAAADLFDAQPWEIVPADEVIGVSCEALDIEMGAIFVVGQAGESFGFGLCRTLEDAGAYMEACNEARPGRRPEGIPQHIMLSFDRRGNTPEAIQREVAQHGWRLARPDAYPSVVMIEPDLSSRPLDRNELAGVTAVMAAMVEMIRAHPELADAWETNDVVSHRATVPVATGVETVDLVAPLPVIDEEERLERAVHGLLAQLAKHPLAKPSGDDLHFAEALLHLSIDHFGALLHELSPHELVELLFEVIPQDGSFDPEHAVPLIRALTLVLLFALEQPHPGRARQLITSMPKRTEEILEELLGLRPRPKKKKKTTTKAAPAKKKKKPAAKPATKRPKR